MTSSSTSHLLLVSFPGWGHARPLCVLAARLVSESENVLVTILTAPHILDKARFEISRQFETGSTALQRIRLVAIYKSTDKDMAAVLGLYAGAYEPAYETLAKSRPITCSITGTTFEAAPAPVAVILDFFALKQFQATRALTGHTVPIIAWATGGSGAFIRGWGPESMGGLGDLGAKADAEAARTNKSSTEAGEQLYKHTDGSVIQVPGVPAMYDYEYFPQKLPHEFPVSLIIRDGRQTLMDCDGFLTATSDAYEKESLDAVRAWFGELQKPVYAVGPLLPAGYTSTQSDVNERNANVQVFLENALKNHGQHSVLLISFGSVFWPASNPEYIEELIDALLSKNFPFILSHASPFSTIPTELSEKVQASGLGLLTTWSPQQFILNHPATGWFLTHGGHGGVTESLGSGVPLICWPFSVDQPTGAAHLVENLKAAFELIEVRTGVALKPVYRSGQTPKGTREAVGAEIRHVLDACRGAEGEELRRNAQRLKGEFSAAWEEGGTAKAALRNFLKRFA
ncbi:UDP-Glycosyltransferase/glycogen phosphorylase [Lyophyllum atratum]|nr:UDP-Glycosyltransferase/glycogen phosphorylase [Lyophyllum atratum]